MVDDGGGVSSPALMPLESAPLHPSQDSWFLCAAQSEGQCHVSCLPLSRPRGQLAHLPQVVREGEGLLSLAPSTLWQTDEGRGRSYHIHLWRQGTPAHCQQHQSVSPIVLSRQDTDPALRSAAAGEGQGQLSHSRDPGTSFSCLR